MVFYNSHSIDQKKKNAFNGEQWAALADALNEASKDDNVLVVVLTGAGSDFSAGQDLSDFSNNDVDGTPAYQITEDALAAFDKPLIAAVKGVSVGGGATILFHCDIVYVGESLRMRLPFPSLGMAPEFASSYLLQANIGAQKAAEIFYSAAWLTAQDALDAGITAKILTDDELLNGALEKANEIAQWPINALRESKRCLKEMHKDGIQAALKVEREAMDKQAGSAENMEAIMAFMQKRKPDFRNLKK